MSYESSYESYEGYEIRDGGLKALSHLLTLVTARNSPCN
jgi:hypothetical protein